MRYIVEIYSKLTGEVVGIKMFSMLTEAKEFVALETENNDLANLGMRIAEDRIF